MVHVFPSLTEGALVIIIMTRDSCILTSKCLQSPSASRKRLLKKVYQVKSSQVQNPHKSKSSQRSTGKSSVLMTGFVVLLLRFSAFGWADVRIIPLSFLSVIVAAVCVCVYQTDPRKKMMLQRE